MKLLVGPGLFDPKGNEAFLVKALKKAADVRTFNHLAGSFEDVLRSLPYGWNPDAILIRDAEYYKIPVGLEFAECPIFALVGDYNLTLNQMLPILDCFDHIFCDTKGVRIFNKLGINNCRFFCLYGFDPDIHRDYGMNKSWDIVFIGNLNHAVQQDRENFLYRLAQLGNKYRVHINTDVYGIEYARSLNRSHLVFNRSIRDEVNMRFFEALGCGAIVINPCIEELGILGFMPDIHYLGSEDPLGAAVRYFEEWSASKREEIRQNIAKILVHHSYDQRARELVSELKNTPVDISKRKFLRLPAKQRQERWTRYFCDEVEVRGVGRINCFHPLMVSWQKHLMQNELAVKNFDFTMWVWWIDLLTVSGFHKHLVQFLAEKDRLLACFGCYREVAYHIRNLLNRLVGGGTVF